MDQKQATIPVQRDLVTTSNQKVEQQSTGLRDLTTIALEEIKPAVLRALNIKRMIATGFKENWRQAFIEDIMQDKADLEIAQTLFGAQSLAQAIEQKEHLYQAAVKPYLDKTKQTIEDFKRLPWQEQYCIVIGNIFEQVDSAVVSHVLGHVAPIVCEKLPKYFNNNGGFFIIR